MTHALHDMLSRESITIDRADQVHILAREVLLTTTELQPEGGAQAPEIKAELTAAAHILAEYTLAESATESKGINTLTALAAAAVVTGDPKLTAKTARALEETYPTNTPYAISNFTNGRLKGDFLRAMHLMDEHNLSMPEALIHAGNVGDDVAGQHLASASIDDARGRADKEAIARDLAIEEARIKARETLNSDSKDDAVPYDPFADDEDSEQAA